MLVKEGDDCYVTTDEEKIKKYYLKAFRKRNTKLENLTEEWLGCTLQKQVLTKKFMTKFYNCQHIDEIKNITRLLPLNKAMGPSDVSYEMIRKLDDRGIETLR